MSDDVSYKILGENAQVLEVNVEPYSTFIGDGGALLYIDEEIHLETRKTDAADEILSQNRDADDPLAEDPLEEALDSPEEEDEEELPSFDADLPEEPERESSLLEKIWVATRKAIQNVGKAGDKEKEPPQESPSEPDNLPEGELADLFKEDGEGGEEAEGEEEPNWYITHFTNESEYVRKIAFTTSIIGKILLVDMKRLKSHELVIQTGTFLCARKGLRIEKFLDTQESVTFTRERFYNLDKLSGDGMVFLQVDGHVIEKELEDDVIRVNLFSLIAYEPSLELDIDSIFRVESMRYEDETQFVILKGSGKYWIQAATLQQLIYRLSPFIFEPPVPDEPEDYQDPRVAEEGEASGPLEGLLEDDDEENPSPEEDGEDN